MESAPFDNPARSVVVSWLEGRSWDSRDGVPLGPRCVILRGSAWRHPRSPSGGERRTRARRRRRPSRRFGRLIAVRESAVEQAGASRPVRIELGCDLDRLPRSRRRQIRQFASPGISSRLRRRRPEQDEPVRGRLCPHSTLREYVDMRMNRPSFLRVDACAARVDRRRSVRWSRRAGVAAAGASSVMAWRDPSGGKRSQLYDR